MERGVRMRYVALYANDEGFSKTQPLQSATPESQTIDSAHGVLTLRMVHEVPEVSEADRATAHAMAVAS